MWDCMCFCQRVRVYQISLITCDANELPCINSLFDEESQLVMGCSLEEDKNAHSVLILTGIDNKLIILGR